MKSRILIGIIILIYIPSSVANSYRDLTRNAVATQSSTLIRNGVHWSADKAIDGCRDKTHCSSGTQNEQQNWIRIDLRNVFKIESVHITLENKNYDGVSVDNALTMDSQQCFAKLTNVDIDTWTFGPLPDSRFVTLRRKEVAVMVSEIQVFGGCPENYCGASCTEFCFCRNPIPSRENLTGQICDDGCLNGWTGERCNTSLCPARKFGYRCSYTCHCRNRCDPWTGECLGANRKCTLGWSGPSCQLLTCASRSFGPDCHSRCHCVADYCNDVDGSCPEDGACFPGWQGKACDEPCASRSFGPDCNSSCHCVADYCNNVDGSCPEDGACLPGWQGKACNEPCASRSFGPGCNSSCHCVADYCNNVNGSCPEDGACLPGWQGKACDEPCFPGFHGNQCSLICDKCANNETCHPKTGICPDVLENTTTTELISTAKLFNESDSERQQIDDEESEDNKNLTIILYPVGGLLVLVTLIATVIILRRKGKNKKPVRQHGSVEGNELDGAIGGREENFVAEHTDARYDDIISVEPPRINDSPVAGVLYVKEPLAQRLDGIYDVIPEEPLQMAENPKAGSGVGGAYEAQRTAASYDDIKSVEPPKINDSPVAGVLYVREPLAKRLDGTYDVIPEERLQTADNPKAGSGVGEAYEVQRTAASYDDIKSVEPPKINDSPVAGVLYVREPLAQQLARTYDDISEQRLKMAENPNVDSGVGGAYEAQRISASYDDIKSVEPPKINDSPVAGVLYVSEPLAKPLAQRLAGTHDVISEQRLKMAENPKADSAVGDAYEALLQQRTDFAYDSLLDQRKAASYIEFHSDDQDSTAGVEQVTGAAKCNHYEDLSKHRSEANYDTVMDTVLQKRNGTADDAPSNNGKGDGYITPCVKKRRV